jgi:methionyl-tRNA synthetase
MLGKKCDGRMGQLDDEGRALVELAQSKASEIAEHYQNRDFNRAVQGVRSIAEAGNRYFDEKQPWVTIKTDVEGTRVVLTAILNVFRCCAIYLKPVLPEYAVKVEKLFGESNYVWSDASKGLEDHQISKFEHLAQRIDPKAVDAVVEASKEDVAKEAEQAESEAEQDFEPLADEITVDDLFKVDLRVAKIIKAEAIKGAGKLLRLQVDLGFEQREILAGIKKAYRPEDLEGRLTVVVANLKPREMKFGTSQGMVMAAGPGGEDLHLLSPDSGAQPGQRIC